MSRPTRLVAILGPLCWGSVRGLCPTRGEAAGRTAPGPCRLGKNERTTRQPRRGWCDRCDGRDLARTAAADGGERPTVRTLANVERSAFLDRPSRRPEDG